MADAATRQRLENICGAKSCRRLIQHPAHKSGSGFAPVVPSVYRLSSSFRPQSSIFLGFLPTLVVGRVVLDPMVAKHFQHPAGSDHATEKGPGLDSSVWIPQVEPAKLDSELLVLRPELRALGEPWRWCKSPFPSSHVNILPNKPARTHIFLYEVKGLKVYIYRCGAT